MPIRQGKASLWFDTKQERDQYDDLMISNIELTVSNESDDNFCLMFVRKKKQSYLTLRSNVKRQLNNRRQIYARDNLIQNHLMGKRDHTINRQWVLHRSIISWGIGYLLLRELPIRNFYARCSIMLVALAMYSQRKGTLNIFSPKFSVMKDQFTDKDIKNYQAYDDMKAFVVPTADNKISQANIWRLNQPAYMRESHPNKASEVGMLIAPPTPKIVAWDGTFNMPLQGLAHPLHKDAKHISMPWWEY